MIFSGNFFFRFSRKKVSVFLSGKKVSDFSGKKFPIFSEKKFLIFSGKKVPDFFGKKFVIFCNEIRLELKLEF
jgi:hypothetical protein